MPIVATRNYLELPYLSANYLAGEIDYAEGMQVRIPLPSPSGMEVKASQPQHVQHPKYLEEPYLEERYLSAKVCALQGMQADLSLVSQDPEGMQVELRKRTESAIGMEVKAGDLKIVNHPKYLTESYLSSAYLAGLNCGLQGMQASFKIESPTKDEGMQVEIQIAEDTEPGMQTVLRVFKTPPTGMQTEMFIVSPVDDKFQGMQVDQKIFTDDTTGMQALLKIFKEVPIGMQAELIRETAVGMSATLAIYNITQLRFLCSFPSRGVSAGNWTSPQGTETGDFGLDNLNTDILEQRAQSPSGTLALWELISDTGVGNTFVDTVAILNHNLTTSALVQVQGSDDAGFGTVKFSFNMTVEKTNMYYIAPTLPTISARYYRFLIQDPTNPDADGSLKIGVILFGSSVITSRRTCYQNPVTFGLRHFKDTLPTEGYTSVSNDRALRKILTLDFTEVLFDGGDYGLFQDYFKTAKTDLKCLIIPRPTRPSSLAVFSKLTQLPAEQHNAIEDEAWYVDLTLDYDESL